jgi:hypothetical protein
MITLSRRRPEEPFLLCCEPLRKELAAWNSEKDWRVGQREGFEEVSTRNAAHLRRWREPGPLRERGGAGDRPLTSSGAD